MRRLLLSAALLACALVPRPVPAETVTASDVVVLEDADGSVLGANGFMADAFLQKAACALYKARPDADPDVLFVVASSPLSPMFKVQSGIAVFRQVRGIGIGAIDRRAQSCSATRRLRHAVRMGDFTSLPDDPRAMLKDRPELPMPALAMMAHEMGHYWMSYASYDRGDGTKQQCDLRVYTPVEGSTDTTCGGYPVSAFGLHWSALFESGGIMFGARHIDDQGDGTFRVWGDGTFKFGPLDQYLMGLRMAEEVGPLMLIRDWASTVQPGDYPLGDGQEKVVEGTRIEVDGGDVVRFEGVRYPPLDPCHWKGLLVIVHPKGKPPAADRVQVLADYANAYQDFYADATDRRGSIDLTVDRRGRGTDECPDPLAPPPPADEGPGTDPGPAADVPAPSDVPAPIDLPSVTDEAPAADVADAAATDVGARDATAEGAGDPGPDSGDGTCLPGALRCNPVGNGVAQQCAVDGRTWVAVEDCGLAGKECRDGACVAATKGGGCTAGPGAPAEGVAPPVFPALALAAALALRAARRTRPR